MKVTLTKEQTIKARDFDAGSEVIVSKEVGERMISEGVANRAIEETENRSTTYRAYRFTGGKKVFRGTNGRDYHAKGDGYVEVKE